MSGAPAELLFLRYQVLVLGSTTPMVVLPSPFQSPTTGSQPGPPYWNCPASGAPGVLLLRTYQVAVPGSKALCSPEGTVRSSRRSRVGAKVRRAPRRDFKLLEIIRGYLRLQENQDPWPVSS